MVYSKVGIHYTGLSTYFQFQEIWRHRNVWIRDILHDIIYSHVSIFKVKILQRQLDFIKHSSGKLPCFFKTSCVVVFQKNMKNWFSLASKCMLWNRDGDWKMYWLEFHLNVPLFNDFEEDTIIFMHKEVIGLVVYLLWLQTSCRAKVYL